MALSDSAARQAALDLAERLRSTAPARRQRQRYCDGDMPLPFAPRDATVEYRRLMAASRSPWARLVVDAPAELLAVIGVAGDEASWARWQSAGLDSHQAQVHHDAILHGCSFVAVWPDGDRARIRGASASTTVGDTDPEDPSRLRRALRTWTDSGTDGRAVQHAVLYDAEAAYRFARPVGDEPTAVRLWWREDQPAFRVGTGDFQLVDVLPHGLGECPVVPFVNDPDLDGRGRSEIEGCFDLLDRIAKTTFDRLMSQHFGAFVRAVVIGEPLPDRIGPDGCPVLGPDGQPLADVPDLQPGVDVVSFIENPGAKIELIAATDIRPFIEAAESDIRHLAAVTRTPAHYLLGGQANPPSAEALMASESGLIYKTRRKQDVFGESWERVLRLAARAEGDAATASDQGMQVQWRRPETRHPAQVADAVSKLAAAGIPVPWLLARYSDATERDLEQVEALATREAQRKAQAQVEALGIIR